MVHYKFLIIDPEGLQEDDHGVDHRQHPIHMLHKAAVRLDGVWAGHQILMQMVEKPQHGMPPREHLTHMQTVERPQLGTHLPGRRILTLLTVERPQLGMHLQGHPIRTRLQGGLLRLQPIVAQQLRTIMDGEGPVPRTTADQPQQAVGVDLLVGEREVILGDLPYVLIKFPPNDLV